MSKFKRIKQHLYQGTMEGKPVSESDNMRERIMRGPVKLSENDFTEPGQSIPKDAGLLDFMKYNAAHFDPSSEENALAMMGMGGIGKAAQGLKMIPGMHLESKAKDFAKAVQQAMEHSPLHKQNITPYAEQEYAAFKTFLSPDGKSGFAIKPDGELVNVFSTEKGRGKGLVEDAVKQGASKLDAFNINEKLPELYKKGGFETYKTEKNWIPGGPDVNYMALRDKHPDLFSSPRSEPIPSEIDHKKDALKKIYEGMNPKNKSGYREPRDLRFPPNSPESLKSKSVISDKTPVMEIDPEAIKKANIQEHTMDHPPIAPKPDYAPKLPEKPFGTDRPAYPETDEEALQRIIDHYQNEGQFPSPKKPR